jgi:sugar O-acyltransferase (sialic acid O-acetyltransferase NeuD family)
MREIVVVGGGGHAKVLISILKKAGYAIEGYTDNEDHGVILGVPYLGNDGILRDIVRKTPALNAIIGIGKVDASPLRLSLQNEIGALGFDFPAICSPHAIINEAVSLGAGTAVLDGVVVNSGTDIGRACILNTRSTVEHDCLIGENVHIAPGVTISGGVTIGDNCMVGIGTNVIQSIRICAGCLIGAGSTVVKDIALPGIYVGNPAKRIR